MARYFDSMGATTSIPQFETELDRFARQLNNGLSNVVELEIQPENTETMYQDILKDSGQGRISSGLKSLELLSHLRNGVNQQDLFLFDSTIIYGTASSFNTSNSDQLVELVSINIGMLEVYQELSTQQTASYYSICLSIANKVKAGSFIPSEYSAAIRRESKKLVNIYLQTGVM